MNNFVKADQIQLNMVRFQYFNIYDSIVILYYDIKDMELSNTRDMNVF